ncbi:RPB9 [Hepatospora eriocheir]|uniref:RPB9 n=1 Tax=Hepatospora eriocheir TaxID=1081669 RepID=A0A1X0QGM0_9MICR|nr:RPB9 [Hepatospora eriocheir]
MALKYCEECNNILYLKKEENQLLHYCITCDITMKVDATLLYKKTFRDKVDDKRKNTYIGSDATLPLVKTTCEKCNGKNVVSFLKNNDERALNNFYLCTFCFNEWRD